MDADEDAFDDSQDVRDGPGRKSRRTLLDGLLFDDSPCVHRRGPSAMALRSLGISVRAASSIRGQRPFVSSTHYLC